MSNKWPTTPIGFLVLIKLLSDKPHKLSERIIFGTFKYSGYALVSAMLSMHWAEKMPESLVNYIHLLILGLGAVFLLSMLLVCIIGIGRNSGNETFASQARVAARGFWYYLLLPAIIFTVICFLVAYFTGNLVFAQ